jgi:hypothetical protein
LKISPLPFKKLIGNPMKALKGRNNYVALTGLIYVSVSVTQGDALGYLISPLRGFFKQVLRKW